MNRGSIVINKCQSCDIKLSDSERYVVEVQHHENGRWLRSGVIYCNQCGLNNDVTHRYKLWNESERKSFIKLLNKKGN